MSSRDRSALVALDATVAANAAGIVARNPTAVPTAYATAYQLCRAHGVTRATLDRLVKAGYLTRRDSDGNGPEYARTK